MKTGKRLLALVLCAVLCVGVLPGWANADDNALKDESDKEEYYYEHDEHGDLGSSSHTVKRGAADLDNACEVAANETWYWPFSTGDSPATVYRQISSSYGFRGASYNRVHYGVDIGAAKNTKVYAIQTGVVSYVNYSNQDSGGRYVIIRHNNGFYSKYLHLQEVKVSVGDSVSLNTVIALSGGSGYGRDDYYANHLHLTISYGGSGNDVSINPCPAGYTKIGDSFKTGFPMENANDTDGKKYSDNNSRISYLTVNREDNNTCTLSINPAQSSYTITQGSSCNMTGSISSNHTLQVVAAYLDPPSPDSIAGQYCDITNINSTYLDIGKSAVNSFKGADLSVGTHSIRITAGCSCGHYETKTISIIVNAPTPAAYTLDVNGWLDGTESGATEGYATFDVWVNGSWVADDVTDFCQSFPVGSAYAITDIRPSEGHVFMGVHSGSIEGTVGAEYNSVMLDLRTVYVLDVNDIVDGVYSAGTEWMYTFDVYLDGNLVADNCFNYFNTAVPYGTAYEISDIKPVEGYQFLGADSGARPLSGVVTNHTGVNLVFKTMAYLDVNGWLDGVECGALTSYGTFDIYIDGVLAADDVSDFNRPYPVGTPYVITDIRPSEGHVFMGVHSGSLEGSVGGSFTSVMLDLRTTFILDVNGRLDGQYFGNGAGYCSFDVYIDGIQVCNDYSDFYEPIPYGSSYVITDIRPAEGLRFLGAAADSWSLTGTVTGTVGIILEFETIVPTYTVVYDSAGGAGVMSPVSVESGAVYVLPANAFTAPDGMEFKAWSVSGAEYTPGQSITVTADVTVTAVWRTAAPAPDPTAPQIVIEDLRVTQGETFTVPVVLKNNPGIAGFNLQLSYDTAMLELIDKTAGDFSGLQFSSLDAMPFRFNWDGGTEENTGTVAAVLTFRAKADAEGTTALELSFGNQELPYDALLTDIPFTAVGGEVEIRSFLPGDANGDGTVTMKDSTTVRQHLAGWTVTLAEAAADANGDGVITMKDSTIIRQYLAGWPVTLGGAASGAKGRTVMRSPMRSVPQIVIEDLTAAPGDTISVPILLKNNPGIAGFDLAVSYDTTVLTLTGVTEGDFAGLQSGKLDAAPFQFNWDGGTEENAGPVAAVLTFRVSAGASGSTGISVSANHGTMPYDSALEDIAFEFRSATVTVRSGGASIRSLSLRGGVASVELECLAKNAGVYCAAYAVGGRMLALLSSPVDGDGTYSFTFDETQIAYVKAFLLDGSAKPLCESMTAAAAGA